MKKRILAMLLAALCIFSMFALSACGDEDDGGGTLSTEANRADPVTLTLCLIAEEVTEAARASLEDALNQITKAELNTNVVLTIKTSAEYQAYVDAQLAAVAAGKGEPIVGSAGNVNDETNADVTVQYPDLLDNQFDVFLVCGYDKLVELVKAKQVVALDTLISSNAKPIATYIDPIAMIAGRYNKSIYAMPNRHLFGEYTYLLLDKTLADAYKTTNADFDFNRIKSLAALEPFLSAVKAQKDGGDAALAETNILQNLPERTFFEFQSSLLGYAACYPEFSGADNYPYSTLTQWNTTPSSLLLNSVYQDYVVYKSLFTQQSMLTTGEITADTDCAAAFVTGSIVAKEAYEAMGYYVVEYAKPVATQAALSESMYAISKYTYDQKRSVELLQLLATDSRVCDLFAYGVEDIHYTRGEDDNGDFIELMTADHSDYQADNVYRGNLLYAGNQLLLTRSDRMDAEMLALAKDNWKLAAEQNMATTINVYDYFPFDATKAAFDPATGVAVSGKMSDVMEEVKTLSATILENIAAFPALGTLTVPDDPVNNPTGPSHIANLQEYVAAFKNFLAVEQQALLEANNSYQVAIASGSGSRRNSVAGQYEIYHIGLVDTKASIKIVILKK